MSEVPPNGCPFPGLRPFEADETHLFFGREGQVDELLKRLRLQRFVAVVGTSGSGKSSLVRAGLLPAICGGLMVGKGSVWRQAIFRPGNDPIGMLADAVSDPKALGPGHGDFEVQRRVVATTLRRSSLGLIEVVQEARMAPDENLLIVVDQFEELFRFKRDGAVAGAADEAAAFVKLLLEAVEQSALPIYVVITMRSDYLGDCAEFRTLPESINQGLYLIPRMTRDQRREAITGPVAVGGGEIAARLVNRLLNDVGDNPDHLPILQHALMRMWDCWARDHAEGESLDLRHYEAVGGMAEALSRQAEEAYKALGSPERRQVAERVFKRLTEKGPDNREVRRACTFGTLGEVTGVAPAELAPVIDEFRHRNRCFLMPTEGQPLNPESLVDISHESLIRGWDRLRRWVEEEAVSAQIYRRLAETAKLNQDGAAGLWRNPDLKLAQDWRAKTQPREAWAARYHPRFREAIGFLDRSQAARDLEDAQQRRQVRNKRLLVQTVFATLLAGLIVSLIFRRQALQQKANAERAAEQARGHQRHAEDAARMVQRAERRVRKQSLDDNNTIVELANRLSALTPPSERVGRLGQAAQALSLLGMTSEAIDQLKIALDLRPVDSDALNWLAYQYLVAGEPESCLEIAARYYANGGKGWAIDQNQANAQAMMGRHEEARRVLEESIRQFTYLGEESIEPYVAPEIEAATRRTALYIDGLGILTADYFGLANILAYAGDARFESALADARSRPKAAEAALIALQWAAVHYRHRPADHGALVAEGALWEEAGYPEWAKHFYLRFLAVQQTNQASRYLGLTTWTQNRTNALRSYGPPITESEDTETLVLESSELQSRKQLNAAVRKIDAAILRAPDDLGLKMRRLAMLYSMGDYDRAKADCDEVIRRQPSAALAYLWRAVINSGRAGPEVREADLKMALQLDPLNGESMVHLSDLLVRERPAEARQWLERSLTANLQSDSIPYVYSRLAETHLKNGDYPRALGEMEQAIRLKDDPSFYGTWARIQNASGRSTGEVNRAVSDLHVRSGEHFAASGLASIALDHYWKAVESLAVADGGPPDQESENVRQVMTRISALVEAAGERSKSIEFWRAIAGSDLASSIHELVQKEIDRLAAAP